jgi:carboxyl-terminal processing protease
MKKVLSLVLFLVFSIILLGCSTTATSTTIAPTTAAPTTAAPTTAAPTTAAPTTVAPTTRTTTTTDDNPIPMVDSKLVQFFNYSTEFVKEVEEDQFINMYFFPREKGYIPYVDISDLISLLLGIIDDEVQVEVLEDGVKVFIIWYPTEEEKAEYGITEDSVEEYVFFDFTNMTVSAPSVDTFGHFSGETSTDFSQGLTLVSSTSEELPAFHANLSDYGFFFRVVYTDEGDKYTIPLSLANLFLTGSMFDVILNGDGLYGVDTYQIGDVNDETSELYNAVKKQTLGTEFRQESVNFMSFAMDYFYGLKSYKGISSFKTYVPNYMKTTWTMELGLTRLIDSLEDMHTGVISFGQNNPDYVQTSYPGYIYDWYYEYNGANCYNFQGYSLSFHGSTAYFRIKSFTKEFALEIAPYMEQIREANVENVVIDLACNGGGVIAGVYHLLNYLTNDDISIYTTTLGANSSWTYDVEGDLAIDADFFILTSKGTYSAANLFTAYAVELGLAKTIGTRSGGGACSVKVLVLPNGAIIQMSSNMNLTFSTFETVEEGIPADHIIDWSQSSRQGINPSITDILAGIQALKSQTPA